MPDKRLHLVRPTGFCGGVRRALAMFQQLAKSVETRPLYVLHELVHNTSVTEEMRQSGACFVDSLDEVPPYSHIFFGAHGVPLATQHCSEERHLIPHDATCPLVSFIQELAAKQSPSLPLIFLGDGKHPEVRGILGHAGSRQCFLLSNLSDVQNLPPLAEALFLCQTTLDNRLVSSVLQALQEHHIRVQNASRICESVLARQEAVRKLAETCDLLLVIGSPHSSNARTLLKSASGFKSKAQIIQTKADLSLTLLDGVLDLGLASATSAPDPLVKDIICWLEQAGFHQA